MDLQAAAGAEFLMKLSIRAKNRYGFITGIENYCQAIWGDSGLFKIRQIQRKMDVPYGMELFDSNREQFFDELHERMERPEKTQ